MKITRRDFVKTGAIAGGGLLIEKTLPTKLFAQQNSGSKFPVVISTWNFGEKANRTTMDLIMKGTNSLDAIESGIHIVENDPAISTVGYGGNPDEDGIVTLDSSIMDWKGNAGSVAAIENIRNPISVAKLVMQRTTHVMLAGDGAKKFALANGFKAENLLTKESKEKWLAWKKKYPKGQNRVDKNNHDTIGMVAIDKNGNMSGGVSTSGLAYKIHGRVGDSPIIGAALFVDNEVGGATSTGNGEFVMKSLGSFLIVEKMREGMSPQQACEFAVKRIQKTTSPSILKNIQVGYVALNKKGEHGAFALNKGFEYALTYPDKNELIKSRSLL